MTTRMATSLVALSTAFATPVWADVTAADVFANQQDLYAAMGISLSGNLADGRLSNPEVNVILPEGAASFQITTDAVTMTENSDGSVTVSYPSPMTISMAGGAQDGSAFSATATMTHDGYTIEATGDADDITYVSEAQNLRIEINDIDIDDPTAEAATMTGFLTMSGWTGTSRVTQGDVITYTSESEIGDSETDFKFGADEIISTSSQTTLPMQIVIAATLPAGGSNIMNLSQATRDGLSATFETTGEGSSSVTETMLNGELLNRQMTQTGAQVASVSFGADGIVMSGEAEDFAFTMNNPLVFPGDLEFGIENVSGAYDIPLNASEEAQDFRIATSMMGVTLGNAIWNMFDPAGQLPRDPAEITFDITGTGTNGTDLMDVAAMSQMFGPPAVEIDQVTIENLRIAAVGAEATAVGAMTFDWTDFETIPGIARPEGQVTVNLNGANQLMDTLVAMGLIPEDQLMMPRMMMGMFSTPVGDDMLETVLEVNSEGHVLANGQRLQ